MRVVVQRVRWARVRVAGQGVGEIGAGLLVLLGVARGDDEKTADSLARKISRLRIFADAQDKMNLSLVDMKGAALVVSQFTLHADLSRGRRPYFGGAEAPERAAQLCDHFVTALAACGVPVATGKFGAMMEVELLNDGPVTLVVDSEPL